MIQPAIYKTNTLNAWLNAKLTGYEEMANLYERRFLPDYKVAFDAWIQLDPINNSQLRSDQSTCQSIITQ